MLPLNRDSHPYEDGAVDGHGSATKETIAKSTSVICSSFRFRVNANQVSRREVTISNRRRFA